MPCERRCQTRGNLLVEIVERQRGGLSIEPLACCRQFGPNASRVRSKGLTKYKLDATKDIGKLLGVIG